jgi:hypothetical protein
VTRPPEQHEDAIDCEELAGELRRQLAVVRAQMEAHREVMRAAGLTDYGEPSSSIAARGLGDGGDEHPC